MKGIIRIFLIFVMFFVSLSANASETHLQPSYFGDLNAIEACQTNITINKFHNNEEFILPQTNTCESIISSFKQNSYNGFGGLRNRDFVENNQFKLVLSYIYSKSYLGYNFENINKIFLTELNPHAP